MELDKVDFDNFDNTRSLVGFNTFGIWCDVEDEYDENNNLSLEGVELANEKLDEFIGTLKEKVAGNMEDHSIKITFGDKIENYRQGIIGNKNKFDDQTTVYTVITKKIPAEVMDAIFLDMSDYSFYAVFENYDTDESIIQGYDSGEYDTGYFQSDGLDAYINNFEERFLEYPEIEKILGV